MLSETEALEPRGHHGVAGSIHCFIISGWTLISTWPSLVAIPQIMTIQAALSAGERFFMFEGRSLSLNSSLALFITMNPMYEFRNVLPSNLKVRDTLWEMRVLLVGAVAG
jgi:hypothetical protein